MEQQIWDRCSRLLLAHLQTFDRTVRFHRCLSWPLKAFLVHFESHMSSLYSRNKYVEVPLFVNSSGINEGAPKVYFRRSGPRTCVCLVFYS